MASVIVGIRLRETNLAMITMGSRIQAIWKPAIANKIIIPRIKNFGRLNTLFAASRDEGKPFLTLPTISMVVPRGQTHPQKNLPKSSVRIIIPMANAAPGRTILSLIEVKNMINGFNLKKVSGGSNPLSGYVVDQSIYTKRIRKKA